MKSGLQVITLTWVFAVKQVKHLMRQYRPPKSATYLLYKLSPQILLGYARVELAGLYKAQEELIDDLDVRPGGFQDRLIIFGIILVAGGV